MLTQAGARADIRRLARLLGEAHPDPWLRGGGLVAFARRVEDAVAAVPLERLTARGFPRLLRPMSSRPGSGWRSTPLTAADRRTILASPLTPALNCEGPTMRQLSPPNVATIREAHGPGGVMSLCRACGQPLPCDALALADEVERQREWLAAALEERNEARRQRTRVLSAFQRTAITLLVAGFVATNVSWLSVGGPPRWWPTLGIQSSEAWESVGSTLFATAMIMTGYVGLRFGYSWWGGAGRRVNMLALGIGIVSGSLGALRLIFGSF